MDECLTIVIRKPKVDMERGLYLMRVETTKNELIMVLPARRGSISVEDYYKEMQIAMTRANVKENHEATRLLNNCHVDLARDKIENPFQSCKATQYFHSIKDIPEKTHLLKHFLLQSSHPTPCHGTLECFSVHVLLVIISLLGFFFKLSAKLTLKGSSKMIEKLGVLIRDYGQDHESNHFLKEKVGHNTSVIYLLARSHITKIRMHAHRHETMNEMLGL
ncbi:hypothetical protein CR513_10662, partial [Mucuna pruriens]